MQKIESMYAFIAQDETGEGVCGFKAPDGTWLPLVGADMDRVKSLMPVAELMAKQSGQTIKLCLFTTRTELSEIKPD